MDKCAKTGPWDLDRARSAVGAACDRRRGAAAVVLLPREDVALRDVEVGQLAEVRVGVDEAGRLARLEQPDVVNLGQDGLLAVGGRLLTLELEIQIICRYFICCGR